MAATPLAAIKEVHQNDETVSQYISQGVWYSLAPDNLDITQGGILVLEHQGMVRSKEETETIHETTRINLIYFYNQLEALDQFVVPWCIAAFDDSEAEVEGNASPVLSIDDASTVSVDIADDEPIRMGVEAYRDKNANNVFSATVPLRITVVKPRQVSFADS